MWLKRWTSQNIVIGGAAGALPPMIGYAAATGSVSLETAVLFGIIFLWTPPHFWALAILKTEDYRRAGVPMLPVVAGERATRLQILLYTLVLAPFAVLPALMGFASPVYGVIAAITGAAMIVYAVGILRASRRRRPCARPAASCSGSRSSTSSFCSPCCWPSNSSASIGSKASCRSSPRSWEPRRERWPTTGRPGIVLTDDEMRKRRSRSVALALVLGGLVVLLFVVTIAKIGGNIVNRPM